MINGKTVPLSEAVGVKRGTRKVVKLNPPSSEGGELVEVEVEEEYEERPGAILLVNIKQDDPMARKNIPQLIQLAGKYGAKVRSARKIVGFEWNGRMIATTVQGEETNPPPPPHHHQSDSNPYPLPLTVVCVPTDQGYYEPDTSSLLRLKVASEYGYGINPSTVLLDKTNVLGSGADPMMRWLEGTCRTPAGLGRIELNFEKFLIDGKTGLPVR